MQRELLAAGIPDGAVVMELCSLSTLDNCRYTAAALAELGGCSALVSTCRWHLPRAIDAFARFGVVAWPPPRGWLCTPPASLTMRVRERLCAWTDSCKMAALRS